MKISLGLKHSFRLCFCKPKSKLKCSAQGTEAADQGGLLPGGGQPHREAAADVQPGRRATAAAKWRRPHQAHAVLAPDLVHAHRAPGEAAAVLGGGGGGRGLRRPRPPRPLLPVLPRHVRRQEGGHGAIRIQGAGPLTYDVY